MAMTPGSTICLKSEFNHKYLSYQKDSPHEFLKFIEDDIRDPFLQFEVVKASHDAIGDDFFHLRCCYNNKFLVRWLPDRKWITASSNDTNEDIKSWSCTLFKASFEQDHGNDTPKIIRLQHAQMGYNLIVWSAPGYDSCLFVASSDDNDPLNRDVFSIADTTLPNLPKRAAFKGDNGMFLGAKTLDEDRPHLRFSFEKATDPEVENEIFEHEDGTLCIKNKSIGNYWALLANDEEEICRILVETEDDPYKTGDVFGMFRANKVKGVNKVGLFNMHKKWYCRRIQNDDNNFNDILSVTTKDVDIFTRVEVIDLDKIQ